MGLDRFDWECRVKGRSFEEVQAEQRERIEKALLFFERGDGVGGAVRRMRAWAVAHGEADTQGLMPEEWEGLARAALGVPPSDVGG